MLIDNNKNQRGVFAFLILKIGWFSGYAEPRRNIHIVFWETPIIFFCRLFQVYLRIPTRKMQKWVWLPTQAGGKGGGAK
jgi:hypothetical protein